MEGPIGGVGGGERNVLVGHHRCQLQNIFAGGEIVLVVHLMGAIIKLRTFVANTNYSC